jgi:hypothetical protein
MTTAITDLPCASRDREDVPLRRAPHHQTRAEAAIHDEAAERTGTSSYISIAPLSIGTQRPPI